MTALAPGTVVATYQTTGKQWDTDYSPGTFAIYEGSPKDAPIASQMSTNPAGGATVPANFTNGTLILSGTLSGLHTHIQKGTATSTLYLGNYTANYAFTGGSQFASVSSYGTGLLTGTWCGKLGAAGCVPATYTAHPAGEFKVPVTAAQSSTWGAIKQLYR
jgi:hypothetical protein